ncbi:hypothetical protein [Flavobacterium sp.]|jgi:hypothetical protein|uniref:hypothetical protein n=1 Tax=Flavobacterium sp. TaxID=239 RepID=UPI0037BE9175
MLPRLRILAVLVLGVFVNNMFAQETPNPVKYTAHNKGKFYIFWGGNRENFSKSDIHFKGDNYDFTVIDAIADDKPKGWHADYVNPGRMTIPQTNFRMGYFINDHYNISLGLDHMKYVMRQDQIANVTGNVNLPLSDAGSIYNGVYNNTPVNFLMNYTDYDTGTPFLTFEHTDGLNYINSEISRVDDFSKLFGITNTDKIQINLTEGIGGGFLYPKTNAKVLGKERHDDFHVSGVGVSAKVGINVTVFKHFFVQGELKGGYINMNDIRTTAVTNDTARQHFMFLQRIISFGGIFSL